MEIRSIKIRNQENNTLTRNNKKHIHKEEKTLSYSPLNPSKEKESHTLVQNSNKKKANINTNTRQYNNTNIKKSNSTKNNLIVPQKILKLRKNPKKLKKSSQLINNRIYKDVFINNFRPILYYNNQIVPKNKRQKNKNKTNNSELSNTQEIIEKTTSIFDSYKKYQKHFFSSTLNYFNTNNINNNINKNLFSLDPNEKYTTMQNSNSNSNFNKTKIEFNPINKNKINNKIKLTKRPPRSVSNLLKQKDQDKIPIIINAPVTFIKNFKSNSERERDEKNSTALLKLKNFLDKHWDNRIELVKEFFVLNQINEDEYYKNISLENFANFIRENIDNDTNMMKGDIETRIPMRKIIDKGIKFKNYSMKKMNKSNSIPSINKTKDSIDESNIIDKRMSFLINNLGFFKGKNKLSFLNENINDKYQISEEGKDDKIRMREKILEVRKFINKNYAANIINKFMGKYKESEKINYFNKRKVGTIYIPDKSNLINSINKQTQFFKLKSTAYTSKIKSIHSFSEKDINDLYTELKQIKDDYINENEKECYEKDKNSYWIKTYEHLKKNIYEKHPENILKEKKKLLEYIVYNYIKGRKAFLKDILK
jgi:hypothetical protein